MRPPRRLADGKQPTSAFYACGYTGVDAMWLQMPVLRGRRSVLRFLDLAGSLEAATTLTGLYVDSTCALICSEVVHRGPLIDVEAAARTIVRSASHHRADGIILAAVLRRAAPKRATMDLFRIKLEAQCRAVGVELVDLLVVHQRKSRNKGLCSCWEQQTL